MKTTLFRARIPAVLLSALLLASCAWKKDLDKVQADNKALTEEKARAQKELSAAGAATAEMQGVLDEVQKNLEDLRVKELKAIKTSISVAQEGKSATAQKRDDLKAEIEDIRKAVRANLDKLATLQKSLKASEAKVTSLERLVGELKKQLEEKEATIAALEEKTKELTKTTEELRGTVKEKEEAVQQREAVIADRETQLATAYVLIAPQSALKKAGLVEKKGAVLGLGGNWQRTGHFDENLFKTIDTRTATTFDVAADAKKTRVLSDHPKDSYTLTASGPKASVLTVTDAARFWKGSRYLVVMLPD
jgi:uncharacterized protein (DUF3084 family)